jgi:hypothetical protein
MQTLIIAAVSVFFLGLGVVTMAVPARALAPFGVALTGPDARNEVRAVYGGFGLAMGVLLALAAWDVGPLRPGAVWAVAVALAGMAFGRLVGRLIERPTAFYPVWFYFWVEAVAAAALLFAAG